MLLSIFAAMQYRKQLYGNYHSTQSGRASGVDSQSLFEREKRQFSNEVLPLIQTNFKTSAAIFDMGCGSGSLLKMLQENGYTNTVGMDISPEQVDQASKYGVQNVQLGNAIDFVGSQNHAFDLLTGMDIIEHFTKDELVVLLENIQNALKPGGMAIFRTPNLDSPMSTVFANGDFTHENYLNASSAEQVMLATGFQSVQVFSSYLNTYNPVKEIFRKILWAGLKFKLKLTLFATARSSKGILLTPNMIIVGKK